MSKITIPFIDVSNNQQVDNKAARIRINNNNWAKEYPYTPDAQALLWHDGQNIHIKYTVDEEDIAAKAGKDNGEVWKDSCAEFFIALDDMGYYNIESNCTGDILLSHRKSRKEGVEYASPETLKKITRNPSLGREAFACRKSQGPWELELTIPATTFFKHNISSLRGIVAKGNFYKCGDDLPQVHFLSWNPISTTKPDFHRPEFFGEIEFELLLSAKNF